MSYERVIKAAENLFVEELEVLAEIAESLLWGQTGYGRLDLENDPRNFTRESFEEDRDWLAYRAMKIVQDRKRAKAKGAL